MSPVRGLLEVGAGVLWRWIDVQLLTDRVLFSLLVPGPLPDRALEQSLPLVAKLGQVRDMLVAMDGVVDWPSIDARSLSTARFLLAWGPAALRLR